MRELNRGDCRLAKGLRSDADPCLFRLAQAQLQLHHPLLHRNLPAMRVRPVSPLRSAPGPRKDDGRPVADVRDAAFATRSVALQ